MGTPRGDLLDAFAPSSVKRGFHLKYFLAELLCLKRLSLSSCNCFRELECGKTRKEAGSLRPLPLEVTVGVKTHGSGIQETILKLQQLKPAKSWHSSGN